MTVHVVLNSCIPCQQWASCPLPDFSLFADINSCFSEMAPVCAVVGGVLSQEAVKVCSLPPAPLALN